MRRLANNVKNAKVFAVFPVKPVTFEGSPKSATKGQGSICFFVTKEKQLKIDSQKEVMDGHNQNICIKSAGAWWQRSQRGSIPGLIFANLTFVQ